MYPIYSIQHDEKYYDNPDKFDPERFNDDNKHKIKPFTYMPFGVGPRNCIGKYQSINISSESFQLSQFVIPLSSF